MYIGVCGPNLSTSWRWDTAHIMDIVMDYCSRYESFEIRRQNFFKSTVGMWNTAVRKYTVHTSRTDAVGDVW